MPQRKQDGGPALTDYRRKRDFGRTGEPRGARGRGRRGTRLRFVVQQHDASTEHYDFRLEAGGVLKSWAVPKGPSLDPGDKWLAVATEDHPLEYAGFEGVIGPGEYGAEPVIVWDCGYYVNRSHDAHGRAVTAEKAIERGHVTFDPHGRKLRGRFALTRMRRRGKGRWLLVKSDDEFADRRRNPVRSQPESVMSGRRIGELTQGKST